MIYLPNRISTVFTSFYCFYFIFYFFIRLVNLPTLSGCSDWTFGLIHGEDPYTVAKFWRRDINFVFMSTRLGWFLFIYLLFIFISCGLFWSCLQVLLFWSLPFFPFVFVVAIHSFRMYDQEFPHILCLFDTFAFLWTWTARHLILWRTVSTLSAISIETRTWFSIFRVSCKNKKVSTCSVIFDLVENEASVLCVFCKKW